MRLKPNVNPDVLFNSETIDCELELSPCENDNDEDDVSENDGNHTGNDNSQNGRFYQGGDPEDDADVSDAMPACLDDDAVSPNNVPQ